MSEIRRKPSVPPQESPEELLPYERSIGAILIRAKEAVISPMRLTLREHNITEPQWRVMRVLNDRGISDATSLAEHCNLHLPSVSRILRELCSRQYVLKKNDPTDQRRTKVFLSQKGQEMVGINSREIRQLIDGYACRFGANRLDSLLKELEALSAAIGDAHEAKADVEECISARASTIGGHIPTAQSSSSAAKARYPRSDVHDFEEFGDRAVRPDAADGNFV